MQRIRTHREREAIAYALSFLPPPLRAAIKDRDAVHFFCGSPVFAGLHQFGAAEDGRSYDRTAHCVYDFHQPLPAARRRTTVCLPGNDPMALRPEVIVHELGHVVHGFVGFEEFDLPAVTAHASTDRFENFAEAFTAHVMPFGFGYGAAKDRLSRDDHGRLAALVRPLAP